jgi:transposase
MAQIQNEDEPVELTDEQWDIIKPLIPEPSKRPDGRGRPRRDNRDIFTRDP